MRESKIMKIFEQYISKFNMNKGNVKKVYFHSLKVMDLCKDIASNLGIFTDEEIIVCGLIGLFHDISTFNNKNTNYMFDDTVDYNKKSVEILFDTDKLIRQITDKTDYDDIIKIAIYCQNKNGLPKNLDEKILHFCKVLKDAHTIDNFRMVLNYSTLDTHIDNFPSDLVYNEFKKYKVVNSKVSDNDADGILETMSSVFGIYYYYSYSILYKEGYVIKLIDTLTFSDKNIFKFFKQISLVMNNFIKRKIDG